MEKIKIAVLIGSLRKNSFNKSFADALFKLAPENFSFHMIDIGSLPLYNQDEEKNPPESVKKLKNDISSADGILFITPEYNRSIPGVLKNAIDHASRPYGESVWAGKPAGVIGVSIGAIGTAMAQQHLRNMLAYLDVHTMGQPEAFIHMKEGLLDESGNIGKESREFLQGWMDKFTDWIEKHQSPSARTAASSKGKTTEELSIH